MTGVEESTIACSMLIRARWEVLRPSLTSSVTRIFGTESGAVSKTTYIAEEAYTSEMMTDTYGDWAFVNDKLVASSNSSGEFRDVVRESFDVGRRRGPTFDKPLDVAYYGYLYETSWSLQSLTTGAVVASASAFDSVNGQSDM